MKQVMYGGGEEEEVERQAAVSDVMKNWEMERRAKEWHFDCKNEQTIKKAGSSQTKAERVLRKNS